MAEWRLAWTLNVNRLNVETHLLYSPSLQADFICSTLTLQQIDQFILQCVCYRAVRCFMLETLKSCDCGVQLFTCGLLIYAAQKSEKGVFICEDYHNLLFATHLIFLQ